MRIVIEVDNGKTTVTVDDEAAAFNVDAVGERMIGFEPPEPCPPDDGDGYIGE